VIVLPGTGANNLPPGYEITDYIENASDTAKLVRFIVTPYTRNATDDGEKCTGINDTAYIWVEPTAVVRVTPKYDTICDGDYTSIILSTKSVPTSNTRFRYDVEAPAGVTVTIGPQIGLPHGYEITDQIDNATDSAQEVRFIVTPYHKDGEDESVRCPGVPDTAYVWVEATALVTVSPKNDTVCDGDNVAILLTSPTVPTREVRFRYTHEAPPGVIVAPGIDQNLPPNYTITDQIFNNTDAAQLVQFIITPYTRYSGNDGEKCTGMSDTAFIWVEPTAKVTVTPKFDTICDGDNVSITLTSSSNPSREVRFRYMSEAPPGVTVIPGSDSNLPPNYEITDQIINTTNSAQEVRFIITPYNRNPEDDGEKCSGVNQRHDL
jgi:hypothetical protein